MDREKIAGITPEQIRAFRLRAHHLDRKLPPGALEAAASVCGFQNSPPGAWETALWNRVEGCTLQAAQDALYREKRLLQAWSVRGAPIAAAAGETPWIYTRGITAALDFLGMAFDDLLPLVLQAAEYLETHTVTRKEALDAA
ncbi:MAG: crosslink repair DNA glycosylase YcaQ family protein, partial [Acutalibacteraceae bacterium]|nr:crosslink repair DNA glycosylase YcaQ family protein [Acutalibacteraceae bacterium]